MGRQPVKNSLTMCADSSIVMRCLVVAQDEHPRPTPQLMASPARRSMSLRSSKIGVG